MGDEWEGKKYIKDNEKGRLRKIRSERLKGEMFAVKVGGSG